MKKIHMVVLLLVIALCASSCASSPSAFTLHNGTKFGMTINEVIAEESKHGFFTETKVEETGTANTKISASGEFVGHGKGKMTYAFSSDGKLIQFNYRFENSNADDFKKLNTSLIKKYGTPDYSSELHSEFPVDLKWYPEQSGETPIVWNGYAPVTGASLDGTRVREAMFNLFGTQLYNYQDYDCLEYAQWMVKAKDGSGVLIDHCRLRVESFQSDYAVSKKTNYNSSDKYELVIYTYFSPDEMRKHETETAEAMNGL